jgi:hypothetical protein
MKSPEYTNRRAVLRTVGAGVGVTSLASTGALAKKGGSGAFGFGTYYAEEPFSLTAWENIDGLRDRVEDVVSCMSGDSAQKPYKPFAVSYESGRDSDEEPLRFLSMPEKRAKNLDTAAIYEFVSRTQCREEGYEEFSIVAFRQV